MGRKRTRAEALKRLDEKQAEHGEDRLGSVGRASFALARGLVYLDPFNRLADAEIVLPLDMIAIPAYQAYMIEGEPSMSIYIRAGETIIPTGGNVRDVQEVLTGEAALTAGHVESMLDGAGKAVTKTPTAYQTRYKKEFARLKKNYVKKDGKWKKNGFKACVKAAHAKARK